jgi:hypothetical protein
MFTYRPSQGVNTTIEKERVIEPEANKVTEDQETDKAKKKRKRRRH